MKTIKHLVVSLIVSVFFLQFSGCKEDETTPPPTITDFTPLEGLEGETITIIGTNFSQELSENFAFVGTASAEVTSATSTQLTVKVPQGATTGSIRIVVNGNATTTQSSFIVLSQPFVTSYQPNSAKAGDVVVINGTGFSSDPTKNTVTFAGGVKATITSSTNTSITMIIPKEATFGTVTITTPGGSFSAGPLLTINLTVENISPLTGPIGTRIKITGTGLQQSYVTYFGSGSNRRPGITLSTTPTEMIVVLPSGATTSTILINGANGAEFITTEQFVVQNLPPAEKTPFPGPVRSFGAIGFTIGEQIYLGLGEDDTNSLSDFWRYDPSSNSWTQMASFSSGGRTRAISFTIDGKGYVCGGIVKAGATTTLSNELWEYNPNSNTWTPKADFPGTARTRAMTFVVGNNAYVGTGVDISSNHLKDFWQYIPMTNTWARKADFGGEAVRDAAGFSISGLGYLSGGYAPTANTSGVGTWLYDPAKDTWTKEFFATPFFNTFDKCFGFVIKGVGYVGTGSRLFQFIPVPNLPVAATGLWGDAQTAEAILTPLPGGGSGVRAANQGIYLSAISKAYVWYGNDKFWEFTPPN